MCVGVCVCIFVCSALLFAFKFEGLCFTQGFVIYLSMYNICWFVFVSVCVEERLFNVVLCEESEEDDWM